MKYYRADFYIIPGRSTPIQGSSLKGLSGYGDTVATRVHVFNETCTNWSAEGPVDVFAVPTSLLVGVNDGDVITLVAKDIHGEMCALYLTANQAHADKRQRETFGDALAATLEDPLSVEFYVREDKWEINIKTLIDEHSTLRKFLTGKVGR